MYTYCKVIIYSKVDGCFKSATKNSYSEKPQTYNNKDIYRKKLDFENKE